MNKFIVLEGNEGVGKGAQIISLANRLFDYSKFMDILLTREPWRSRDIRKILAEDSDPFSQAEKLAKLYVQDRREHVRTVVSPSLEAGVNVISDRYKHSTIAYQSCQGINLDYLLELHRGLPVPDLTLVLDLPVEVILERLRKRKDKIKEKKFETQRKFLEDLRATYLEMPNICKGEPIYIIDGNKSSDEVSEEVWNYVKPILE